MAKLRIIDLFAGCGGLTQGFEATKKFRSVAAVEHDLHAAATYTQNFGDHVYVGDIAEWVQGSIPTAEVVVGGPPCQGFSALGKRNPHDPRNQMWRHYVSTLRRVRPAFFVMENVPQFLRSPEYAMLQRETDRRGMLEQYRLESYILNAKDFGAPQARRRAFVIGRRLEMNEVGVPDSVSSRLLKDAFPSWLDAQVDETELPDSTVEFRDKVIPGVFKTRDLHVTRRPTALSLERYRAIPAGGSRRDLPDHLLTPCWRNHKSGAGDVMGRLAWNKPSVTIRTEFFKPEKGRYLHPAENRPITHAEAALIQSFPEEFLWCGTKVSIARQIGNAVPPALSQAVAEHLAKRLH